MKKLLIFFLLAALAFSSAAAEPDLSSMSFDELVALRDQLNLAIWSSREWQEVTVPGGVWKIGEDIPAGHWTVRIVQENGMMYVSTFSAADETGTRPARGSNYSDIKIAGPKHPDFEGIGRDSADFDLKDGWYIKFSGAAVFTPYAGKPDFGFRQP